MIETKACLAPNYKIFGSSNQLRRQKHRRRKTQETFNNESATDSASDSSEAVPSSNNSDSGIEVSKGVLANDRSVLAGCNDLYFYNHIPPHVTTLFVTDVNSFMQLVHSREKLQKARE